MTAEPEGRSIIDSLNSKMFPESLEGMLERFGVGGER